MMITPVYSATKIRTGLENPSITLNLKENFSSEFEKKSWWASKIYMLFISRALLYYFDDVESEWCSVWLISRQ